MISLDHPIHLCVFECSVIELNATFTHEICQDLRGKCIPLSVSICLGRHAC